MALNLKRVTNMSNQLIPVIQQKISNTQIDAVNAKELHSFLKVGKRYTTWISGRINQYNFKENQDFIISPNSGRNSGRGRPSKEYIISLDMAKELSMVERTDKGREARRYFIDCERRLNELPQNELLSLHASQTLVPIRYHGLNIVAVQHNNETWIDFRSVVNAANLDYRYQVGQAKLEILDLGRVEGKLSLISMDNLKVWLEGICTDRMKVTKLKAVTRAKYEIHPFLVAKLAELSQPVELPKPANPEPEAKRLGHYHIHTVMEEVNEFHPDWIIVNRKALTDDVEFFVSTLMEAQGKIRQRINPLITTLGIQDQDDDKENEDFWKAKKAEAFAKLQEATAS
jgi:phage anti-repressor protein